MSELPIAIETHGNPQGGWTLRRLVGVAFGRNAEQATYILVTLAVTPFLYRGLGATNYGIWLLLISQVPILKLLDPGIHPVLLREIIAARRRGDIAAARPVVANGLAVVVAGCAIVAAIGFPLGQLLLRRSGGLDQQSPTVLLAAPLALFWGGMLAGVLDAVLYGSNRYAVANATGATATAVSGTSAALLVGLGYGLNAVALVTVLSTTGMVVAKYLAVRRAAPTLAVMPWNLSRDRATWAPILSFGPWAFVSTLAWVVSYNLDNLLVGSLISASALGAYGVTQRFPNALRTATQATFWALFPFATELHRNAEHARLRRAIPLANKFAAGVGCMAVIGLWGVGPLPLRAWVGDVDQGALLLRLGLVANLALALRLPIEELIWAVGRLRRLALIHATGAALNLTMSIALTLTIGKPGPIVGTIASGLFLAVAIARIAALELETFWRGLVYRVIALPVIAAAPSFLIVAAGTRFASDSFSRQTPIALFAGVLYAMLLFRTVLDRDERMLAYQRIRPLAAIARARAPATRAR